MSSVRSFIELFSLAPGSTAPTEAPPSLRLPVLIEALRSESPRRQRLALLACQEALKTDQRFRPVETEPTGLRVGPRLWSPAADDEIVEAYRQVWLLVREQVDLLTGDERDKAVQILLLRAREVTRIHPLSDLVLDTLRDLSTRPFISHRQVVQCVEEVIDSLGRTLPVELFDRWQALRDELVGASFSRLLQRYVGLDLHQDHLGDDGRVTDATKPFLEKLASQAVTQPDLLDPEWGWLLAGDAPGAFRLGYEMATRDHERTLLPVLLDRLRTLAPRANGFLLSGYLRVLAEADLEGWEDQLDRLADDEQLRTFVAELTWRGRLTDRGAQRILDLARERAIPIEQLEMFGMGGVIRSLSVEVLHGWLDLLLGISTQRTVATALQIFFYYYVFDRTDGTLPEDLTWQILTHEALFRDELEKHLHPMTRHSWEQTAARFLGCYPDRGLPLATLLLDRMRTKGGIDDGFSSPALGVLSRVLDIDARGVWSLVASRLGPPIDVRAYRLGEWLHGGDLPGLKREGALTRMPEADVWEWVEADIENRAWLIASIAPSGFFRDQDKTCWVREVLVRYGDREDVRRNVGANFGTEVWWGSEAEHWEGRKADLLKYRLSEDHPRVLRWIDDYADYLDRSIERARAEEERGW